MKGLILKDFLNLKKYIRTLFGIIALYAVIFIPQGNANFLEGMVVILCAMAVVTSIGYDDLAKWDKYALTMPITRKDVVMSKYIFTIIFIIIGSILSLLISIVASTILNNLDIELLLEIDAISIALGILFTGILIPLIYKFGIERSRIIIIGIFAIPTIVSFAGVSILNYFGVPKPSEAFIERIVIILPYIIPEIAILILVISYFITLNIYNKKDF